MQPHQVLLRAVGGTVSGADVLFVARGMLGNSAIINRTVTSMVVRLLELPYDTDHEIVMLALRSLPESKG